MLDLDDDIARIAKLRGHDPSAVAAKAAEIDRVDSKLSPGQVKSLFQASPTMMAEIDAYDALPDASRQFIRDCPLNVSALKFGDALKAVDGREVELISLAQEAATQRIADEMAHRARRRP